MPYPFEARQVIGLARVLVAVVDPRGNAPRHEVEQDRDFEQHDRRQGDPHVVRHPQRAAGKLGIDARNELLQLALVVLVSLFEVEVVAVRANVIEDLCDPRVDRGVAGVDMVQEPRCDVHGPLEIGRVRLMRQ